MNLVAGTNYDPGTAVSKSTATLIAMTAFDTTNLRLAVTVPPSGKLLFRLKTNLSGATTMPQVLLGVLDGSTVVGRQVPMGALPGTALATTNVPLWAEFLVTGLTPGASKNYDAAYGVETIVAATNIHYGGPNNATANDAWGGFAFEAWDPQPITAGSQLSVDANGRVDVIKIAGTTQTARDIGASVLLSSGTGTGQLDFTSGVVKSNLVQILATALTETAGQLAGGFKKFFNIASPAATMDHGILTDTTTAVTNDVGITQAGADKAWSTTTRALTDKVGFALSSAGIQAIWDALTSALTTVGSVGKLLVDNINATISSRLASASYTAPDNASITAIKAKTDNLPASPASEGNVTSVGTAVLTRAAPGDAMALTSAERNSTADALLERNVAGGSSTGRKIKEAIAFLRNRWAVSGATLTVYDTDDTTPLWTSTVQSDAAAEPVVGSDPS